ncbi:MAG: hypothetical protein ACTSXG_02860 [Alphaproteobacteria bacterium]
MAAIILSENYPVKVITLDTVKAGGIQQLQNYLKSLNQPIFSGVSELKGLINDKAHPCILIDTPGLDITKKDSQVFLGKLMGQIRDVVPILILPADINPMEARDITKLYVSLGINSIIPTRLDVTQRCGGFLRPAFSGNLKIIAYAKSPHLTDGLHAITPQHMLERLQILV